MDNSLAIINFGDMNITIYGSQEEPLWKVRDIMCSVLQYDKPTAQRWFRDRILCDPELVASCNQELFLTEDGLYETLFASKQEIAKQFRKHVRNLLKSLRKQTQKELEQAKLEIEELKKPKPASIYKLYYRDRLLYIGKDKSKIQNRPQQHLTERRKIAQNNQIIDIFLATIPESEIKIVTEPCFDFECDQLEKHLIQQLQPEFNQSMNNSEYQCHICQPQKIYKNRANFEKHILNH